MEPRSNINVSQVNGKPVAKATRQRAPLVLSKFYIQFKVNNDGTMDCKAVDEFGNKQISDSCKAYLTACLAFAGAVGGIPKAFELINEFADQYHNVKKDLTSRLESPEILDEFGTSPISDTRDVPAMQPVRECETSGFADTVVPPEEVQSSIIVTG